MLLSAKKRCNGPDASIRAIARLGHPAWSLLCGTSHKVGRNWRGDAVNLPRPAACQGVRRTERQGTIPGALVFDLPMKEPRKGYHPSSLCPPALFSPSPPGPSLFWALDHRQRLLAGALRPPDRGRVRPGPGSGGRSRSNRPGPPAEEHGAPYPGFPAGNTGAAPAAQPFLRGARHIHRFQGDRIQAGIKHTGG